MNAGSRLGVYGSVVNGRSGGAAGGLAGGSQRAGWAAVSPRRAAAKRAARDDFMQKTPLDVCSASTVHAEEGRLVGMIRIARGAPGGQVGEQIDLRGGQVGVQRSVV